MREQIPFPVTTLLLLLSLASCERSDQGVAPAVPEVGGLDLADAPVHPTREVIEQAPSGETVLATERGAEPDEDQALPPEENSESVPEEGINQPELRVFWEDGAIAIEGALKSRIQVERIGAQLGEAFSGVRIENRLVRDYDRVGVGWGNRVTEGFLIPYFHDIEDAEVGYVDGVVVLKGRGTRVEKQIFQKLAATIFVGMYSDNIDNQIETE